MIIIVKACKLYREAFNLTNFTDGLALHFNGTLVHTKASNTNICIYMNTENNKTLVQNTFK